MAVRVEETYTEREQKINAKGKVTVIEVPYFAFGVEDEDAALNAVRTKAATRTIEGMQLSELEMKERINKDTWRVNAIYASEGSDDPDDPDDGNVDAYSFAFDTGGGTMHRNQSLKTVVRVPSSAPDFNGAIEVDNEGNVNGVDVTMPVLNFTETHTMASSRVSTSYRKTVAGLTGSINASSFRGFAPGEVLFLGASGTKHSKRADAKWEITFRFAVSPNQTSLKVGNITIPTKRGWDYLWVRYSSEVTSDKKNVIKKPIAAYVEQVYPEGDFGNLGLGT